MEENALVLSLENSINSNAVILKALHSIVEIYSDTRIRSLELQDMIIELQEEIGKLQEKYRKKDIELKKVYDNHEKYKLSYLKLIDILKEHSQEGKIFDIEAFLKVPKITVQ